MTLPPMPPFPQLHWFVDEWTDKALWAYHTPEQLRTYAEQYGRLCAEASTAELDRLQARVAALEVDAERLDYLDSLMERREFQNARRPNEPLTSDLHIDLGRATLYERNLFGVATSVGEGETVRAAIDTARKAKP